MAGELSYVMLHAYMRVGMGGTGAIHKCDRLVKESGVVCILPSPRTEGSEARGRNESRCMYKTLQTRGTLMPARRMRSMVPAAGGEGVPLVLN